MSALDNCAVCGKAIPIRAQNSCPVCNLPCHTGCAGKRRNAPCDRCRESKQLEKKANAPSLPERKQTPSTASPSLFGLGPRRGVVEVGKRRTPTNATTTTKVSASVSRSSQPALPLETPRPRVPPLPRTPADVTISPARQAHSATGAAAAGNLNGAEDSFALLGLTANSNSVSAVLNNTMDNSSNPGSIGNSFSASSLPFINNNVIIPQSTLDLFFQHFNTLQDQFNEIKSFMNRNCQPDGNCSISAPAAQKSNNELLDRLSEVQEQVSKQSSQLEALRLDRELLLEENKLLKEQIKEINADLSALRNCASNVSTINQPNCPLLPSADPLSVTSHGAGGVKSGAGSENCKLIIQGILKREVTPSNEDLNSIAFAVLNTILPTINRDNVTSVRTIRPHGPSRESEAMADEDSGSRSRVAAPPSCVVRLSRAGLVRDVMRAKRALANNYLNTNDINPELLGSIERLHTRT